MRKIILFMSPPGINIHKLSCQLISRVQLQISYLTMIPFEENNKSNYSFKDYYSELAEFSERLTRTINDSGPNETIIISGFFITSEERSYIYNAIKRANKKINNLYGVWIEDTGLKLKKNAIRNEVNTELFNYLFKKRCSPSDYNLCLYTDIYYITKILGVGTSRKHSSIYSIEELFKILGKECQKNE